MISALGQNDRYIRYISVIWEGPLRVNALRVTAELIEMVQYSASQINISDVAHFFCKPRNDG